jgi:hypothetical protein
MISIRGGLGFFIVIGIPWVLGWIWIFEKLLG